MRRQHRIKTKGNADQIVPLCHTINSSPGFASGLVRSSRRIGRSSLSRCCLLAVPTRSTDTRETTSSWVDRLDQREARVTSTRPPKVP